MNYAKVRYNDIANGEGVRTSLFVSGCNFHCPECFNQEQQDFNYGQLYTADTEAQIMESLTPDHIAGLSILGGDPMWQDDAGKDDLIRLSQLVGKIGKTVWIWSGYTYEQLMEGKAGERAIALLNNCDVLVDGLFDKSLADRFLVWKGSANQRVIDLNKTRKQGQIILIRTRR